MFIHDRAAEFLSEVVQEVAMLLEVTHLPISGGHPQTNGLVKKFNQTLKQMLSKLVSKGGHNWVSCWDQCCLCTEPHRILLLECHHSI